MDKQKIIVQIVWGVALVLMGILVFYRIPQVMPKIESIGFSPFLVRFCFYLMGIILIGGGARKIYHNYQQLDESRER